VHVYFLNLLFKKAIYLRTGRRTWVT
jgi:hypothetical protein